MRVVENLDQPLSKTPVILTIGNFDGVHLGHQKIIKKVVEDAKQAQQPSALITFKNHPATVLHKGAHFSLLTPFEQKIELIEKLGIDIAVALTFTEQFAKQSAEQFLQHVPKVLPFNKLILGFDARIGHDRLGNSSQFQDVAKKLGFKLEFISSENKECEPISSSRIRKAIKEGNFPLVKELLGREYSLLIQPQKTVYPDVTIFTVKEQALPPTGSYDVLVYFHKHPYKALANITDNQVELTLLNHEINIAGQQVLLVFT